MVKTLCFQCRGCGFDPRLGNEDPTCLSAWPKKLIKKVVFALYFSLFMCNSIMSKKPIYIP